MIYSDFILNDQIWSRINQTISKGLLPHSLLFHGPKGSGKEAHAIELAGLLNCEFPKNNHACGSCISCNKIISFQHGNVKLITPLPRGGITSRDDSTIKSFKGEKALAEHIEKLKKKGREPYYSINYPTANTILINSIREIKHDIFLSKANMGWTIILIFQSEYLCIPNPTSANALLKILEEPPRKTLFILCTSNHTKLLDTIKSRCQQIYFPPINKDQILAYLTSSNINNEEAQLIAHISNGDLALANQMSEETINYFDEIAILINACFSNQPTKHQELINLCTSLKRKDKQKLMRLFQFGILFFRDLIFYKNETLNKNLIFNNKKDKIKLLNSKYQDANWAQCITHLENAQNYILKNGNLNLIILTLIIDMQNSFTGKIYDEFNLNDWISTS